MRPEGTILLDMKMPVMNGYEASRHLRADSEFKQIPVVAITASALKEDEDIISKLCDGYLRKPISRTGLLRELMKHLKYEVKELELDDNKVKELSFDQKLSVVELSQLFKNCTETVNPLIDKLRQNQGCVDYMHDINRVLKEVLLNLPEERVIIWQQHFEETCETFDNQKISETLETWPMLLESISQ